MRPIGGREYWIRSILVAVSLASLPARCGSHSAIGGRGAGSGSRSGSGSVPLHPDKQQLGAPDLTVQQRMCDACGAAKVKFGVADSSGLWNKMFCKSCGIDRGSGVRSLDRRCAVCDKMGIFGPKGGVYGGTLHCRCSNRIALVSEHHLAAGADSEREACFSHFSQESQAPGRGGRQASQMQWGCRLPAVGSFWQGGGAI